MHLFTKVLLIFNYFVCIGCRISKEFYCAPNNLIGGTVQDIKLSEDMCQNKSCLIIKQLKN